VVTATHDLENWCVHDVIGLEHGTCVDMVGLWLCCGRKHMVLVGNDNDKNAGCVGGVGVGEVFRRSSDISPTRVAGGNGGTEQW